MTVHRPDPECNTNDTATAPIPAGLLTLNANILARREERARERARERAETHAAEGGGTPNPIRQPPEPMPSLGAAQTLHDFASTLHDFTRCSEPQKPKPLPVKKPPHPATAEESIVAVMIGSGNRGRQAARAALVFATKYRHGIQTGTHSTDGTGFGVNGEFVPEEGHARALVFVRVLLHAPTFASCRGNGVAFVARLATVLGDGELALFAVKLGCETEDLVLAADHVRTLLGENMRAVAALAMHDVVIPPHVLVHIRNFENVLAVVKLMAALVTVHGKRDGTAFVSQHDAATILGKAPGAISRAFSIAVRLGVLERVSQGHHKHANAPGVASVYRVPWIMAK